MKIVLTSVIFVGLTMYAQTTLTKKQSKFVSSILKKVPRAIPYSVPFSSQNKTDQIFQEKEIAINANYNIRNQEMYYITEVDSVLKGVLAGKARKIKREAENNKISPYFLTAVMCHESANGCSTMARDKNNVAGIYDGKNKRYKSFDNVDECIEYTAKLLAGNTYRRCQTIEEIKKIYCPNGAANDKNGMNAGWCSGVVHWMSVISNGKISIKFFPTEFA